MRQRTVALLVATVALYIGLAPIPAGAASGTTCSSVSGAGTWTPPVPPIGSSNRVAPTFVGTLHVSGCTGGGVSSANVHISVKFGGLLYCFTLIGQVPLATGTAKWTWNTGASSTVAVSADVPAPATFAFGGLTTSGLFTGSQSLGTVRFILPQGGCISSPLSSTSIQGDGFVFSASSRIVRCLPLDPCNTTATASASAAAPGLDVTVSGTPSQVAGSVLLTIAPGTLPCPHISASSRPVAKLTDTGFSLSDRLTVAATLPLATSTSGEEVCFDSTIPFRSQSNPTVAKAGTGFLLKCSQVANTPPCLLSSTQSGSNALVKFVVPGGDPNFEVVPQGGKELFAYKLGPGKQGSKFTAQFEAVNGVGHVTFMLAANSGPLPNGCTLTNTGLVSGTPTTKGRFQVVIEATDSSRTARHATLPVTIIIS